MKKDNVIKRVAFIYLVQESEVYFLGDDVGYSVQRRPQLGLQYLCAVLEKNGIKTDILDQSVLRFNMEQLIDKLNGFDMAGFYCSDPQEEKVKAYSRGIKDALGIPVLVGGPATLTNSSFLDDGCDFVVHGEGELTIAEIVEYYNGKRDISSLKGVSYKKDGKVVVAVPQDMINDLDVLPFPDRSKIDIAQYHDYFLFGMRKPYMTIIASRGCAYQCHFCTSYKIWGRKYRRRSVDNVLAEIDDAVKRYGVRYLAFQDDIFGLSNDWIEEFCNKLTKRPYRLKWMAILHPFSIKTDTERMLKLLKKAGCDTLSFGLQSAHPQILKNIARNPGEPEALRKVLKTAEKLGFITAVAYIFGLPGDTEDTVRATADYSLDCGATLSNYFMLSVLRGSEIERLYRGRKISELSADRIEELAEQASRNFYRRPWTVLKILYFMLKNPMWIMGVGRNLPSILARVGLGRTKKKQGV